MNRVAALIIFVLTLSEFSARASMFGEENASLSIIAANGIQLLKTTNDYVKNARKFYDEFHAYARYASDAADAFNAVKKWNMRATTIGDVLDATYPDAASMHRDLSRGDWWSGHGQLQYMSRSCLDDIMNNRKSRCVELEAALTAKEVRENMNKTFGPIGTGDIRASDDAAAIAYASASNAQQRAAATRKTVAPSLAQQCAEGKNAAACQAAANQAQINSLEQLAEIQDQMAEQTRLQAIAIEQENARRKREIVDLEYQRQLITEGVQRSVAPPAVQIETGGFNLMSDQ